MKKEEDISFTDRKAKSINDFIRDLQSISPDKMELPLVIDCPNGLEVYLEIKMRFKDGDFMSGNLEKMVITYGW